MKSLSKVALSLVCLFGTAASVELPCSGAGCRPSDAAATDEVDRAPQPCQLSALSITETSAQLDCLTSLPSSSSTVPDVGQSPVSRRLSLELRELLDADADNTEASTWSTWLTSVLQLPVQLNGLIPFRRYEARLVAWNSKNQLLNIGNPGSFMTKERLTAPSSEPQNLTTAWAEPGRVLRVAWRPPNVSNTRLTGYTLQLEQWPGNSSAESKGPSAVTSEFVRQGPALVAAPVCPVGGACHIVVSLSAVNQHGAGPAARDEVVQPAPAVTSITTTRLLLLVGGALKTVAVPGPSRYITVANGNDAAGIVAFAVDARQQLVFSVDHLGGLSRRSLSVESIGSQAPFELPRLRQKVLKLTVDWVARHVYILTKPGDILRAADWYGTGTGDEPTKVGEAPFFRDRLRGLGQIQLQVDPLNGYLFLLLNSSLYRSDLPRGGGQLNWTQLPAAMYGELQPPSLPMTLTAFRVLPTSQRLLLVTESNASTVMSSDLSGRDVTTEARIDGFAVSRPIIRLLSLPSGRLAWSDGSTVASERVSLRQRKGSVRELECAEPTCQPKPTPLSPPRLEVFCGVGGSFARVRLPEPSGEQSESAFRQWRIAVWTSSSPLKLHLPVQQSAAADIWQFVNLPPPAPTASVSAVAFFDQPPSLPPINADALWSRPVVCARQRSSNTSGSLRLFAMMPASGATAGAYRLELLNFNETSMVEPRVSACQENSWPEHYPAYMSAMGSRRAWVGSGAGEWLRIDISDAGCQWRSRAWSVSAQHIEYEWLSGSVLWIGDDASIYRSQPDGSRRLLHRTAATHFTLLTSRALLLWSTTNQVWAGSLSGGAKRLLLELPPPQQKQRLVSTYISAVHVEEAKGRPALNLAFFGVRQLESQHRLFYAVFNDGDSAALFSAQLTVHAAFGDVNCSASDSGFVATLRPFSRYSQLQVLGSKVLWSHRGGISVMSLGGGDGEGAFFNDSFLLVQQSATLPFAVVRDQDSDLLDELAKLNLSVIPTPVNASLVTKRFPTDGELLVEWPEASPPGLTRYLVSLEIDGGNRSVRLLDRSWLRQAQVPPLAAVRLEITPMTAWASSDQSLNLTIVAPISAPKRPVNLTVYRHPKAGGAADVQLCWSPPDLANSRAYPVQEYRVTLRVTSSTPGSEFGQHWSKHRVNRQRSCFGAVSDSPDQISCFSVAACNSRGCTGSEDNSEQLLAACSESNSFDRTGSLLVRTDKPGDASGLHRDLVYEDVGAAATPVRQQDVTAFAVKRHHARIFYAIGQQVFTSSADQAARESIYSRAISNDSVLIYWMGFDWLRDNLLWFETATSLHSLQRTRLMLIEFGRLPQATVVLEMVGQSSDVRLFVVDRQLRFRRESGNYQSLDLDHLIPSDSLSRFAVGAYLQRDFAACSDSLRLHPADWALCDTDTELNASLLLLRGSWDLCEVSSVGSICACLPITGMARRRLTQYDLVLCEVPDSAGDRSLVRILSVLPEPSLGPVTAQQEQQLNFGDEPLQYQQQQQQQRTIGYSLTSILVDRANGQVQRSARSLTGGRQPVVQSGLRRLCYNSTSVVASLSGVSVGYATAEVLRPVQSNVTMLLRDVTSNDRIVPTSVTMFSTGERILLKLNFSDRLLPGRVYEPILSLPGVDSDENLTGCRFRSAATPPNPPSRIRFDDTLGLHWDASISNGAPVICYELSLVAANATDGAIVYWKRLPNVTHITNDAAVLSWAAAVRINAVNAMGQSAPSPPVPVPVAVSAVRYSDAGLSFVTLMLLGALVLLLLGSLPLLAYFLCKRSPKPTTVQIPLAPVLSQEYVDFGLTSDEDELRRLQDTLRRQQPTPDAAAVAAAAGSLLAVMTRVSKRQVNVVRFLGSGAFGQVFEGFVRLRGSAPRKHPHGAPAEEEEEELPCAVKMVKKTASAQEKADFLREAALVSRFDHRHIVRCLGVCVDSDPHFMLLELMEGGDLLGFLRRSRGCPSDPCAKLGLASVVKIILDVANGCCYLESQKFVHRDIAARNCLVTQRCGDLLVKIGDFGLARDVYRNDYYKKDVGRAMLPVRWMSPEALTDGVFSSQSDVWAFGVLCWESLTLGQQPYAGKSNGEVLRFVRGGGILEQPSNAPEPLYHLMLMCWKHDPSHRPTFVEVLQCVEGFHVQSRDSNGPFAGPMSNRCSAVSGLRSRHASSMYHNQRGSAAGGTAQTSLTSLGSLEGAVGGCSGSPIQYTTLMLREGLQQQQQQQFCTVRSPALGRVNIPADFGSPRSRPPLPSSQLLLQPQQHQQHLHYIAPLAGSDEESDVDDARQCQPLTVTRTRVLNCHSSSGDDEREDDAESIRDDGEENLRQPFLPPAVRLTEAATDAAVAGGSGSARRPLMGVAAFQTRSVPLSPPDLS